MKNKLETQDIEFKEKFGDSVLKTLCAFANTKGGKVILGMLDNGTIKGVEVNNETLREMTEKIVSKLGIHPSIEIKKKRGIEIVEITVNKSNVPISFEGKYYERIGNTTREMKAEKLKEFFLKGINWDSVILEDAEFKEIDDETVRLFIKMANRKGRMLIFDEDVHIPKLFEHLKLSTDGKLTNGAIILFGKEPQNYFINAVLRVIRLKNDTLIVGDRFIKGNLFKQVFEGEEAIKNFLHVRYEIKGLERKEIWDYPLPAIREALINALIHRDYFKSNVQTQIKIYDDYIWFYNRGGLPEGITIDQLTKPHPSVPRNPLIVHIFYLAGLIEEVGSGIGRIIDAMDTAGLPEPEFKEEMGGFSVYFRKDVYTEDYLRKLGLNERQIKAVLYLKKKGRITNKEYRELTGLSDEGARIELNELIKIGLLLSRGKGRNTYYVLK